MASCGLPYADGLIDRRFLKTAIIRLWASHTEDAPLFQAEEAWHLAGNGRQCTCGSFKPPRVALKQGACVGMTGIAKYAADIALFDDFAGIHDDDPVAQLSHSSKMMGYEKDGAADLPLEIFEQMNDLDFKCSIERSRRLVGDEERGSYKQRHGNTYPLTHAAGKVVRIGADPGLGIGNSDPV